MPAGPSVAFLRRFLDNFFETEYVRGRLTQQRYVNLRGQLSQPLLREMNRLLRSSEGRAVEVESLGGTLTVLTLREPSLREFPFLQFRSAPRRPAAGRRIRCFIGHRFQRNVERSLRFNLRSLLEPYRIAVAWAGLDMRASGLFDQIVRDIKTADFCIFDNLGTLNRPNVYIEAGIAYALKRPFIFCEYTGRAHRVVDTGSIPADLEGLVRVQYTSYQDLCEQLYFALPDFLRAQKLR